MDKYDCFFIELDNGDLYCLDININLNMYTIHCGHLLYDKNNKDLGKIMYMVMMPYSKPLITSETCKEKECIQCPLINICNKRYHDNLTITLKEVLEIFKPILKRKEYKRLKNEIDENRN